MGQKEEIFKTKRRKYHPSTRKTANIMQILKIIVVWGKSQKRLDSG